VRDYKKYTVWQKAHWLVLDIYKLSHMLPKDEVYGLINQMKRSSSAIPTNIAEGCGRDSDKDFCRFLYIAAGSANELEYQILLCKDLNFIEDYISQKLFLQIAEIKKMLTGLITKLNANS
jgi:four helix bundle protein